MNSYKRFKQNALRNLVDRPSTEAEWVFLMRHHGVPTRLLDWSESPLVALYFAVADEGMHGVEGAIWCLLPLDLNNLAGISQIPGFDDDDELSSYLPTRLRLPGGNQFPIAAVGVRNSPRMYAQHGMFTISHRDAAAIEALGTQKHIWRIMIPASSKPKLLSELRALRVDRLALFPELDSCAAAATEALR